MKKMSFWNYASKFLSLALVGSVVMFSSCKEEEKKEPAGDPVASFQSAISETNFLEVTFTDFSQNASSWAWSFGDDNVSVEQNPTHTYAETGTYTVSLTVTNADGVQSSPFTADITITDPNVALKLLTGDVSKTWRLFREGTSMSLGSGPDAPAAFWPGLQNDGKRPCLYLQEFTFGFDGTYTFDDKGQFWAEFGVFNGVEGCDENTTAESCFEATAANMVNECGDDVSAWLSGSHTFTYDASTGKLVLNGEGAWIGIPKLDEGIAGTTIVPLNSQTSTITITEEDGYDLMNLTFTLGGDFWNFYYASYNTGTEPDVVTDFVPPACTGLDPISPTEISHTFASNEASEWVLMQPVESGSGLEFVANPDATDVTTTPTVGKYVRVAPGVPFQELKFKLDPLNAINFENLTTITMDVYLPSSNDYTGSLTDNVFVGFGNEACNPPEGQFWWYENQIEYQELAVAKDAWTTVTFQLNAPSFVNDNSSAQDPFGRNDFDMIYIQFGGGGHEVGADFYIKNFKIQ